MAKEVVMPALGMAQETGTLLQWLKAPGDTVTKGEPLMEVETDKTTAEIEAPASGILANVSAQPGDVIPVGQRIAVILAAGESASTPMAAPTAVNAALMAVSSPISATPVAQRMAAEHKLDLSQVKPQGGQVQKEDVLAYLALRAPKPGNGRTLASPKARRLAQERGLTLAAIAGSGPEGAVLAADVLAAGEIESTPTPAVREMTPVSASTQETVTMSRMWQIMTERLTQAWTTIPHFYLLREVNASRLVSWRESAQERATTKITYTDLLVKLTAAALLQHPRLNASWLNGTITLNRDINIGLAVAVEQGLLVPVIHHAGQLGVNQLATRRAEIVDRAQKGKLGLDDLNGGTFTISNLGMYGVDAFNAIVNPPQVAILAVGRVVDRVVAVQGQAVVQPMLALSLSCDHRVVDGARGAQFLQTLAELIEDPMRLWD